MSKKQRTPFETACAIFISAIPKVHLPTGADSQRAVQAGHGVRWLGSIAFRIDASMREIEQALIRAAIAKMGTKAAAEEQIIEAAWSVSPGFIIDDPDNLWDRVKILMTAIIAAGQISYTIITPNFLMQIRDGIPSIKVGPVTFGWTRIIWDMRNRDTPYLELRIDGGIGTASIDDKFCFRMPAFCCRVTLSAAKNNVPEEALWLIDAAVSLLRLSHKWRQPLFPTAKDSEPHPWFPPVTNMPWMIDDDKVSTPGTMTNPSRYVIDSSVRQTTLSEPFKMRCDALFNHKPSTLAERVAQGLGWMTRARRAGQKSEAFLFYFTALEALLSDADKSSPIVQTVARNVASILTDTNEDRYTVSRRIVDLYGARSTMVHASIREVAWTHVSELELYTEAVYHLVLHGCDLSQSRQDFFMELRKAGFGTAWQSRPAAPTPA